MSVLWYDTVDSTNAELLRRSPGLDNMSVIAARCQAAGRGQRGHSWTSAPGENLTFSVLVRHGEAEGSLLVYLNMAVAVAVRDFLREEGVEAVIKWPNDIYVGGKKICGILIENRLGAEAVSVVGIGINLNQTDFPDTLPNPTSFRLLTGRMLDPEEALERFMKHFRLQYDRLSDGSPEALKADYENGLYQKGLLRPYRDLRTGEVFDGIIRGISPDGRLRMMRPSPGQEGDGIESTYGFQEISYLYSTS